MSTKGKKRSLAGKPRTAKAKTRQADSQPAKLAHELSPKRLPLGLEAEVDAMVPHSWTIQAIDPALPPVLSTPSMIGLMEHATANAVRGSLPPGTISVGTRIEVDHLKAVPTGAMVRAKGRLAGYQGRFLVFDVEAWSDEHLIGRGRVFRAIVESHAHEAKAKARIAAGAATSSR